MSLIDLPMLILTQIPTRTRLADTRALMQLVQATAEQDWEREISMEAALRILGPAEAPVWESASSDEEPETER